ncbi:MAG TPA: transporter substrate-binding domain-containing protein [Candidatus Limnocylindrales bacterium]|nr:transporter substrate-binding domain-containing protein [Candidatus Limnocylindrales bacterium]
MKKIFLISFTFMIAFFTLLNRVYGAELDLLKPGVVIIAHDDSYPPYEWAENGKSMGFDVDLVKAVIERMGLKVEFKPDAWANVLISVKVGKADAIQSAEIQEDRKKSYDFSESYGSFVSALFVKTEDKSIQSLKDLEGKIIAGQRDSFEINYVRQNYPGIQVYLTQDPLKAIESVLRGRAAACVVDKQVGLYLIKKNFPGKLKNVGEEFGQTLQGLAVLKGTKAEFLKKFNQALSEIKADGTYDRIYAQWFK